MSYFALFFTKQNLSPHNPEIEQESCAHIPGHQTATFFHRQVDEPSDGMAVAPREGEIGGGVEGGGGLICSGWLSGWSDDFMATGATL